MTFPTGGLGGGQTVTMTGAGMDDTSTITICGDECTYVSSTSSELICKTPIHAGKHIYLVVLCHYNQLQKQLVTTRVSYSTTILENILKT